MFKARVIALATVIVSMFLVWFLVHYIYEERRAYTKISKDIQEMDKDLSRCLPPKRKLHNECTPGFIHRKGECLQCVKGTFSLSQWTACRDLLACDDVQRDVRISKFLYTLGNWQYYLAEWKSYEVLYAKPLVESAVVVSFKALSNLPPHPNLLYPIGVCEQLNTIIFSFEETIGSANQLDSILRQTGCDNWIIRFRMCLDYVRVLSLLHSSGPFVLCSSHTLQHTLSQFLITRDLRVVLATFDNMPQSVKGESGRSLIKCSEKELEGRFVALEQKWPYSQLKVFNPNQQPGYNEKSDIWKVPDVTNALMDSEEDGGQVLDYLVLIHHRCKKTDPRERPNASEVMGEYERVWKLLTGGEIAVFTS